MSAFDSEPKPEPAYCCEAGCTETATHSMLVSVVGGIPICLVLCCTHTPGHEVVRCER